MSLQWIAFHEIHRKRGGCGDVLWFIDELFNDGRFYTGGIGRFDDGRIAEIFINGAKVGSTAEANAQDAAIIASLALQHGCPLETIRHALIRTGGLGGPLATLLNEVERQSEDGHP